MWLTVKECQALWGKSRGTIEYAIWHDRVKARQCVRGSIWLIEYNSCVPYWGLPTNQVLFEEILTDVNY